MKNTKILLFLFSLIITIKAQALEVVDKGYRLSGDSVVKDFTLMRLAPTHGQIASHIIKANYKVNRTDANEIAENILKVSSCFLVDPWILTALIQKESSFQKNAVSSTKAAGLTQFTTIGFKEVHDQLGYRGRTGATENATLYFTSKIRNCIDPSWIDLWARVDISETDPNYYNSLKDILKDDVTAAVTYGAILLKTYLSFVDVRNEEEDMTSSELYFKAMQIYNGEPGEAKVRYAKQIFKNLQDVYPNPVNFPFLLE